MLTVAGEFSRPSTAKLQVISPPRLTPAAFSARHFLSNSCRAQSSLRPTIKGSSLIRPKSPEPSSLLSAQFQAEELTHGMQVLKSSA